MAVTDISSLHGAGVSDFSSSSVTARRPEVVFLPNGDKYVFFSDQVPDSGEIKFSIEKTISGSKKVVMENKLLDANNIGLPSGLRMLCGCRISDDKKTETRLKWIGWIAPTASGQSSSSPKKVYPFIEVYSPSVSYSPDRNEIILTFWTNIYDRKTEKPPPFPSGYVFDKVAIMKPGGGFHLMDGYSDPSSVRKVLCYARGSFIKASLDAKTSFFENADKPKALASEYWPVFRQPVILHEYENKDATVSDIFVAGTSTEQVCDIIFLKDGEVEKIKMVNRLFFRLDIWMLYNDETSTLPATESDVFIGVKIPSNGGVPETIFSEIWSGVATTQSDTATDHVKRPLYQLSKAKGEWYIKRDFRKAIGAMAYP